MFVFGCQSLRLEVLIIMLSMITPNTTVSTYFIKNKSEVLEKFKEFHNFATNLAGNRIKVLRSDNGREYCSRNFDEYLKQKGITIQLTVPSTLPKMV